MDQLKKNKMLKKVMPMLFVRVKLSRSLALFINMERVSQEKFWKKGVKGKRERERGGWWLDLCMLFILNIRKRNQMIAGIKAKTC